MARTSSTSASLSPSQAQYVLERLRQDRKVTATEVGRYLSDLQREIEQLEQRLGFLRELHQTGGSPGRSARKPGRPRRSAAPATGEAASKPKKRISRATAQSRKIQGVYLSLIRQIAPDKRPQFQKVAQEAGREEAIKKMRSALK